MFSLKWSPEAWREYIWLQENDKATLKRVNAIIKDIQRNGFFVTLGKPEMLKHDFSGYASIRIDRKNRIIYSVQNDTVFVIQCGDHYSNK